MAQDYEPNELDTFRNFFSVLILTFHNFFLSFSKIFFIFFLPCEKRVIEYICLCFLHVLTAVDDVDKIIFYTTASYQDVDGHIPFNDFTAVCVAQHTIFVDKIYVVCVLKTKRRKYINNNNNNNNNVDSI